MIGTPEERALLAAEIRRVMHHGIRGCTHEHSVHYADASSTTSGRIDWCPRCGAIAIDSEWASPQALLFKGTQLDMIIAALDFSVRRSEIGRKAGKASIARLTPEQHRAQAVNGAKITNRKRWGTP